MYTKIGGKHEKIKNKNIRTVIDYVIITLGILIASYALETILIPNTILDGGITGISIIISKITPLAISNLIFVLNIPFIIIGYKNMGKNFLIKAIYSMVIYSIFLSLFHHYHHLQIKSYLQQYMAD